MNNHVIEDIFTLGKAHHGLLNKTDGPALLEAVRNINGIVSDICFEAADRFNYDSELLETTADVLKGVAQDIEQAAARFISNESTARILEYATGIHGRAQDLIDTIQKQRQENMVDDDVPGSIFG